MPGPHDHGDLLRRWRCTFGAPLLAVAAYAIAAGCTAPSTGPADAGASAAADAVAADGTGACAEAARRPDGACCPSGEVYVPVGRAWASGSGVCAAVGPPSCAATVATDPAGCVPRWCSDPRDPLGVACPLGDPACADVGRTCSAEDLVAGLGCPAGSLSGPSGACVLAGVFPGSGLGEVDAPSPQPLPPFATAGEPSGKAVPPLTPLAPLADTFFCRDSPEDDPRICRADEASLCARGPGGALPDPKRCVLAGLPWPSGLCPPGFIVAAGAQPAAPALAACAPDPTDCATATAPADLYVDANAGDDLASGASAAPLRTIAAALSLAAPGARIELAPGTYAGSVIVDKAIEIHGRCAAKVRIVGQAGEPALAVVGAAKGSNVVVGGLELGGDGPGVDVQSPATVVLKRAWIQGARRVGVQAIGHGAEVTLHECVVADTDHQLGTSQLGSSVAVAKGATMRLFDVRASRGRRTGAFVNGAGSALLGERVLIDGTRPQGSNLDYGWGAEVVAGAQLSLNHARLSGNHAFATMASGFGTSVTLTATLIDHTQPRAGDGNLGGGLRVVSGAKAILQAVRMSANRELALNATHQGTSVIADGLLIDGNQVQVSDGNQGRAISLFDGAQLWLTSARLSGNRQAGLVAVGSGTLAELVGVLIDGSLPIAVGFGWGLSFQAGAKGGLRDIRIHGGSEAGLYVRDPGTVVHAERLVVDAVAARPNDGVLGTGLRVEDGAALTVALARVTACHDAGVLAVGAGAALVARGLLVDDTRPRPADGLGGRGVGVQSGAAIVLTGSRLIGNREAGLVGVLSHGPRVVGVMVRDTIPDGAGKGGTGLALADLASPSTLLSSSFGRSHTAAVSAWNAEVSLRDCVLAETRPALYTIDDPEGRGAGTTTELGDGLVAASSKVAMERCVTAANVRAGIYLRDGAATLTQTWASGAFFGLAYGGAATPNAVSSRFEGSGSAVASETLQVPPAPTLIGL